MQTTGKTNSRPGSHDRRQPSLPSRAFLSSRANAPRHPAGGYALLLVLGVVAVSAIILTATVSRSMNNARLNSRSNDYTVAEHAAQAATEKIVARMAYDFQGFGAGAVTNNLGLYRTNIPNASEDSYWTNIVFSDAQGHDNQTYVGFISNYSGSLPSQYPGLFTSSSPFYRIISNARVQGSPVTAAVQEDILLALVPITQYAIFYNGLLEFSTCATMTVNGRIHANGSIYTGTGASLTCNGTVTTTSTLTSPGWNSQGPGYTGNWADTGTFNGTPNYRTNVPTVSLSISSTNVHSLIDLPPSGELATTSLGSSRLFNQAQTVLLISNTTVIMNIQNSVSGQVPGADPTPIVLSSTNLDVAVATNFPFLSLTNSFTDQREGKTILAAEIDVAQYAQWIKTNTSILTKYPAASGTYPTILYVADNRTNSSSQLSAIRLLRGTAPPANGGLGWSIATPNPLYVKGNYNCTNYAGTTNTTVTVPCGLMSDALTIQSSLWNDTLSAASYTARVPSDTTINAAILTGVIPSTGSTDTQFSGGVHNLPRLLENWSGHTLTLNTSIINLFVSNRATHQFIKPGTYYLPPTRQFSYDLNFANPNKQPPGIPSALVAIRVNYATPPPNVLTYNVTP